MYLLRSSLPLLALGCGMPDTDFPALAARLLSSMDTLLVEPPTRLSRKEKRKIIAARYRAKHKDKILRNNKEYRQKNKERRAEYNKKWLERHPEFLIKRVEIDRAKRRAQGIPERKKYEGGWRKHAHARNRERYRTDAEYRLRILERVKKHPTSSEYKKKWRARKLKEDPMFALKIALRRQVGMAFAARQWKKMSPTHQLIGGDWTTVKQWIEDKFAMGMSWDNHRFWHIDHIKPLASANTEKELKVLFHYTNLQPLWALDNLKKGSRYGF